MSQRQTVWISSDLSLPIIWLYQATFPILQILIPGTSTTLEKMEEDTASNNSAYKRCQNDASPYTKSSLRDFFTVLALSFHAVFEGLAVGLENDSKDVWLLFAGKLSLDWMDGFRKWSFLLTISSCGSENVQKPTYIIFKWSLNQLYCLQCNKMFSVSACSESHRNISRMYRFDSEVHSVHSEHNLLPGWNRDDRNPIFWVG